MYIVYIQQLLTKEYFKIKGRKKFYKFTFRRDLADGFLTREYLEKFPEIGAEEKTFLAQLLFNLGLEKVQQIESHIFRLTNQPTRI